MNKPEQPEWDGIAEKWLEKESVRVSVLTDLQTLIKEIISSRDTYWKERVEETRTTLLFIGEKVLNEMSEIYAVDIKYADKKQWLEPSEFERIFLHRFNEAGLKALDTLLENLIATQK